MFFMAIITASLLIDLFSANSNRYVSLNCIKPTLVSLNPIFNFLIASTRNCSTLGKFDSWIDDDPSSRIIKSSWSKLAFVHMSGSDAVVAGKFWKWSKNGTRITGTQRLSKTIDVPSYWEYDHFFYVSQKEYQNTETEEYQKRKTQKEHKNMKTDHILRIIGQLVLEGSSVPLLRVSQYIDNPVTSSLF